MSVWPRARPPIEPAAIAVLAELDQVIAELRAAGSDRWVAHAERTAADVREYGVDSVVKVRMSLYRNLLAAAARGGS